MHTQILLCLFFSALSLKMGCGGGGGESSLGEGLVRNNVFDRARCGQVVPCMPKPGVGFRF